MSETKVTELRDAAFNTDYEGSWLQAWGETAIDLASLIPEAAKGARGDYRITVEFTPTKSAEQVALEAEAAKLRDELARAEAAEADARAKAETARARTQSVQDRLAKIAG